jgi:hypothetical protein
MQCGLDLGEEEEKTTTINLDDLRAEYLAAKLATERKRCKFLEIRIQTALEKLIPADEVGRAMFAKGRIIRDGILNIPDRVSSLLATINDAAKIHEILTKELREVLEELSRDK